MAWLAGLSDVAVQLGLPSDTAMSNNQVARASALLDRVSTLFATEAGRPFVAGEHVNRCRVSYDVNRTAHVRLPEPPESVTSIVDDDGYEHDITAWTLRGRELTRPKRTRRRLSEDTRPRYVTVTYSSVAGIPPGVVEAVSAIVARYIRLSETVGPSAGAAVDMGAGAYRATFAEWTTQSVHLTAEDLMTARAYRDPQRSPIVTAT